MNSHEELRGRGRQHHPQEDWPRLEEDLRSILLGSRKDNGLQQSQQSNPPRDPARQRVENLRDALIHEADKENFALLQVGCENFNKRLTHYERPPFVNQYLKKHQISPLKKKSEKFPRALYYCHLCDYHCDKLSICIHHIEEERHSRLKRMQELETTLYHLPKPSKQHLEILEQKLLAIDKEYSLSEDDMNDRRKLASDLETALKKSIDGCAVALFGSSLSGFGLKDSNVNLHLRVPKSTRPDKALLGALECLEANANYTNVNPDFETSKVPIIYFSTQGFQCELTLDKNTQQTSALLRDYFRIDPRIKTLSTCLRVWARECRIDRQSEGTLPAHAFAILLVFFLQQGKEPVLPCIHDYLEKNCLNVELDCYDGFVGSFKTTNKSSISELWIEFFKFFTLIFNAEEKIVSIRVLGGICRKDTNWRGKKLSIEDPFCTKRPLTRSVHNNFEFIGNCFKIAYLYFGTVQTITGPSVTKILVSESPVETPPHTTTDPAVTKLVEGFKTIELEQNGKTPNVLTLDELERNLIQKEEQDPMIDFDESFQSYEAFQAKYGTELTPKQAQRMADVVPKNIIVFQFDGGILTNGQKPMLHCNICSEDGHVQSNCPENEIPVLVDLGPMPNEHKSYLNEICRLIVEEFEPKEDEIMRREGIVEDLTRFIRKTYSTAKLTLYGSSRNGFAIKKSDLDISLTFSDKPSDSDVDAIAIIEQLAEKLRKMQGVSNIQPITSAKVPILKFLKSGIEGDISLYNVLAQENTEMLLTYSKFDERVKTLGYVVKYFAKTCEIGDASKGSLSSYAYILMLIFYLQQCSPPVLPVLQEFYIGDKKPEFYVDGWNAWFCKDADFVKEKWEYYGQNRQSVAELWIGFLEFYGGRFKDKSQVITIRQRSRMTKLEKMWSSPIFAIEDPFDLDHNLGTGLSLKMHLHIKKAFCKARNHFCSRFPNGRNLRHLMYYLFDIKALSEGPPPNDRGCRLCRKIGHLARDCPRKSNEGRNKKRIREERLRAQGPKEDRKKGQKRPEERRQNMTPNAQIVNLPPPAVVKDQLTSKNQGPESDREPGITNTLLAAMLGTNTLTRAPPSTEKKNKVPYPTALNNAITAEDLERSFVEDSVALKQEVDLKLPPPPGFKPSSIDRCVPSPSGPALPSAFQPVHSTMRHPIIIQQPMQNQALPNGYVPSQVYGQPPLQGRPLPGLSLEGLPQNPFGSFQQLRPGQPPTQNNGIHLNDLLNDPRYNQALIMQNLQRPPDHSNSLPPPRGAFPGFSLQQHPGVMAPGPFYSEWLQSASPSGPPPANTTAYPDVSVRHMSYRSDLGLSLLEQAQKGTNDYTNFG